MCDACTELQELGGSKAATEVSNHASFLNKRLILHFSKVNCTLCKIVRHRLRHPIFHATYSKEICAKRDLLKPQPAESSHPRSQGSKKRPLIRRPPLLHVPPPPFCQIATNQSSISVQCFQFSPPLLRSDKLPNPSFLDLSPLRLPLRLTVMSLAGRSPPFGGRWHDYKPKSISLKDQ